MLVTFVTSTLTIWGTEKLHTFILKEESLDGITAC